MKNLDYQKVAGALGRLVPARLVVAGNEGWAWGAGLLGVVVVAMALAQLSWRLVPVPQEGAATTTASTQTRGAVAPLSITELVGGHLFGQPLAEPSAAVNAPETTLNLTLSGIFALDSARALAIIASGGADQQPYKLGDTVPGGAKVHEIVADRVILERAGRYETLTLPKDSLESNNGAPAGQSGKPGPAAARLGEIRNRLKANPSEVMGMNAVQPVMENGQLKGYKLADNPYTPVLREAGLMPEDVVTQVNGIPVTDQARGGDLLNQLSSAGRIELVVDRGGVPTTLSVELGK
ncbi:MAG TPA: type II secretion system protein GspC [Gammaproteobacteria bacterium]